MYGAYQAGAWKTLADVFRPDLVVGASIGALTGWAIAGGCDPDELVDRWLNLEAAERYRWKFPRSPVQGLLDTAPLQEVIQDLYNSYKPRVSFAVVLTDLFRLQPRIFRGSEVTWRHLAASTAVAGLFDQVPIDGRLYSDGGLLATVPLWAAVGTRRHQGAGDRRSARTARPDRQNVCQRHAPHFALSRLGPGGPGSHPLIAPETAGLAAGGHLLEPCERRALDPGGRGRRGSNQTFPCELF